MHEEAEAQRLIVRMIGDFLRGLTSAQISSLASGGATIAVLPPGAKIAKSFDLADIQKTLSSFSTRLEGERFIKGLKLGKPDVYQLAKALGVEPGSKDTIAVLVDKIVGGTVGGRADSAAMRH